MRDVLCFCVHVCESVCMCDAADCRGRGRVGFAYTLTDGKRKGV